MRVHAGKRPPEVLREARAALGSAVVQAVRCSRERLSTSSEEVGVGWRGISEEEEEEREMEGDGEAHLDDVCLWLGAAVEGARAEGATRAIVDTSRKATARAEVAWAQPGGGEDCVG